MLKEQPLLMPRWFACSIQGFSNVAGFALVCEYRMSLITFNSCLECADLLDTQSSAHTKDRGCLYQSTSLKTVLASSILSKMLLSGPDGSITLH